MRERYGDISGGSGIREYEIGDDFIRVWFADGAGYEYNSIKPGQPHVEAMKRLAAQGRGLSTYIGKHVTHFARRLPVGRLCERHYCAVHHHPFQDVWLQRLVVIA